MVSNELSHGCQLCDTSQVLVFSGYGKVREFLYVWVIVWVEVILDHIDVKVILSMCGSFLHGVKIQLILQTKKIVK